METSGATTIWMQDLMVAIEALEARLRLQETGTGTENASESGTLNASGTEILNGNGIEIDVIAMIDEATT
jgi:hypothetical protein